LDRRYDSYENGEARLVHRDDKMMPWISKRIPKPQPYQPRDVIAVDINEKKIVYGDHVINEEIDTKIDEAHRWKKLAEDLQKKYSSTRYPAWRRRRGILRRIRSYHRKARDILEDWARKTSLKIVKLAKRLGYAVAREDLKGLIESLRDLPKDHRKKLIMMGYKRLGKWIDWQTKKQGVPLAIVNPNGTSSECPKCDSKGLEEIGYRRLRCPRCDFEGDRDVIGKLNIRKRALKKLKIKVIPGGSLTTPTAPDDRCKPE
jgi:IS605 OrfB family transposase